MPAYGNINMDSNFIPYTFFPWKGQTFNQITSTIQRNRNGNTTKQTCNTGCPVPSLTDPSTLPNNLLMKALPLAIYRREIASRSVTSCNPRTSTKIDIINGPGGSITTNSGNGLVNTLDINTSTSKEARPNSCSMLSDVSNSTSTTICSLSQQSNALRRLRSAGMITRKFKPGTNESTYCTSNSQYLINRAKTFSQNQYHYFKQGDALAKAGFGQANVYVSNAISHCQKYHISAALGNNTLHYQWLDGLQYLVTFPDGYYAVEDLAPVLNSAMTTNGHYYVFKSNMSKVFLLNIAYNTFYTAAELQSICATPYVNNTTDYVKGSAWTVSAGATNPQFVFLAGDAGLQNAIGFNSSGSFPALPIYSANQYIPADNAGLLSSNFVPVYYKPNNAQFSQQGAVSSSSQITRLKYDTINTVAAQTSAKYGPSSGNALTYANAMAYNVPETYTVKTKTGYPLQTYPKISKYTGEVIVCSELSLTGQKHH